MKKLTGLLVAGLFVLGLSFTSCNNDDDVRPESPSHLPTNGIEDHLPEYPGPDHLPEYPGPDHLPEYPGPDHLPEESVNLPED